MADNQFVFSSQTIEDIKNRSDQGFKVPRHEKYWFSNQQMVKKEGIIFDRTDLEVEEYMKCTLGINNIRYINIETADGTILEVDGDLHIDPNSEPVMSGMQYFAEKYCKIKREDGSIGPMKLRDYQKDILDLYDQSRFSILMASRQIGKCFTLDEFCELYDKNINKHYTAKMYEIWFKAKEKKKIYDYLKYFLYKFLDKLN